VYHNDCRNRVVLLGASNLTRGVAAVLRQLRARLDGPVDVLAAMGFGRSYGVRSSLSVRALPSILACKLWEDLANRPQLPTYALVADIGNDIAYGMTPDVIEGWLAEVLARLAAVRARTIVVQLPLATLAAIRPAQLWLLQKVFFSRHDLALDTAQRRAADLGGRIESLTRRCGATLVAQGDWFGFDPIHYPMRSWNRVWGDVLSSWGEARTEVRPRARNAGEWLYLRTRTPAQRWIAGREQGATQPVARLRDGTVVSLY
jgi:hypothetical protein